LKIECGSGTYVRSIGRDIGESLGSRAIMTALTREKIGPFLLADAVLPDTFDDLQSAVWIEHLLPLELGVALLPRIDLNAKTTARILMGQAVRKDEIPELQNTSDNSCGSETTLCAAFSPENYLISLLELGDSQYVKTRKNFADRSRIV
jgi:tRNA U55 pseudouridine synthase TruB